VYKLASMSAVARLRYTTGSAAVLARLSASVQATRWLNEAGFPAVRPLDVPQPVAAHGYLVTFWHCILSDEQDGRDIAALAGLLRPRAFNQIGEALPAITVDGIVTGTWSWDSRSRNIIVRMLPGKMTPAVRRQVRERAAVLDETLRAGIKSARGQVDRRNQVTSTPADPQSAKVAYLGDPPEHAR
jgi:hypothetical protein